MLFGAKSSQLELNHWARIRNASASSNYQQWYPKAKMQYLFSTPPFANFWRSWSISLSPYSNLCWGLNQNITFWHSNFWQTPAEITVTTNRNVSWCFKLAKGGVPYLVFWISLLIFTLVIKRKLLILAFSITSILLKPFLSQIVIDGNTMSVSWKETDWVVCLFTNLMQDSYTWLIAITLNRTTRRISRHFLWLRFSILKN